MFNFLFNAVVFLVSISLLTYVYVGGLVLITMWTIWSKLKILFTLNKDKKDTLKNDFKNKFKLVKLFLTFRFDTSLCNKVLSK